LSPRADLRAEARGFADQINDLLNRTVTTGVRLTAVLAHHGQIGWVGYQISKDQPYPGQAVPLTLGRGAAHAFLHVMHTLTLDDEARHLTAERTSYGLYLDPDPDRCLFHYDYARESDNDYPAAHVQVNGDSPCLHELLTRLGRADGEELGRLHFPVGGRRYRPCLEDVVEFLILEGLAAAHDGWERAINEHRDEWHRRQLRAAVRRDPETARRELARLDQLEATASRRLR
jgi:hypothetical protein